MGAMTDEFLKFAKLKGIKLHYVTQAENEARVREIAAALEDAGAKPCAGSLEDIAWSLYNSNFGSMGRPLPTKPATFDDRDKQRLAHICNLLQERLDRPFTPESLNSRDAASFLGIEEGQLEYLVRRRKLRFVKLGDQRGRIFRVEDLRAFLQSNLQLTAEEILRRKPRGR